MKNKKYLFICSTQYAILNSINAVLGDVEKYNGNVDIVIFHQTDDIKNLSKKIKESKIFSNVYDFPFINNISSASMIKLFVFPEFFLGKLCFTEKSIGLRRNYYNVIIAQNQLYGALFRRIHKNADVYLLEDGLSSYTGRTLDLQRRSLVFRLVNKMFMQGALLADIKGQFLYNPDMFFGVMDNLIKLPVHKIQNNATYNRIFRFSDDSLYKSHKFVYLGVPYYGLRALMLNPKDANNDFEEQCKFIVDDMMKLLKETNFIYRTHPIEKVEDKCYKTFCKLDVCQNMWEMECQNTINDDHVLVSFFSTAAFTPKLLYGKEPYVIFLYKILGIEFLNADDLICSLRATYRDPHKVIQPKNLDELFTIIERLESKNCS